MIASIISCIDIKCSNMQYKQNELKQAKLFDCMLYPSVLNMYNCNTIVLHVLILGKGLFNLGLW